MKTLLADEIIAALVEAAVAVLSRVSLALRAHEAPAFDALAHAVDLAYEAGYRTYPTTMRNTQ